MLGDVTNQVQTGGGQSSGSAAIQARTVIAMNVSPGGTPAALYSFSSPASARITLDAGPLAEQIAKLLEHGAGTVYGVPLNPSAAGAVGSVAQVGTGTGTIAVSIAPHKAIKAKCSTGGTLGTAAFQFSLDGGITYGAPVLSVGGATWAYLVPGTFCTLTFAAATYVGTKTVTIGVDGVVTNGALWVGVVTQASSPIDNYDFVCTVVKGGALGVATLSISPDGGASTIPTTLIPSGGVVVIPGTGIVLTCANAFVANDTYSFLAVAPGYSTSDITAALNAIQNSASAPVVAMIHLGGLPSSASGAFSAAATLDSAMATARSSYGKQWQGIVECPCSNGGSLTTGDTIVSGGAAIADAADTETTIVGARVGQTLNYTSVCVATHRQTGSINGFKLRRPAGWILMARVVEDDPHRDPSEVARNGLDVYAIGRDEWSASSSLHDAQLNVLRTYPGRVGVYLAIEASGFGWRNVTTDPSYQDADAMRILNAFVNAITVAGQKYLGSREATNADGTIAEAERQIISADLDGVAKRSTGLLPGGSFTQPQASAATSRALPTSQLGAAPKRLDIAYTLQPLGFVSSVKNTVSYSGTISVTG